MISSSIPKEKEEAGENAEGSNSPLLQPRKITAAGKLSFIIQKAYSRAEVRFSTEKDKWNAIIPHLYLGILPGKEDAKKLSKIIPNLKLVVSAVESFEFLNEQQPLDWHNQKISHHQVPVKDHSIDISPEHICETIIKIRSAIDREEDVYVHCKAGKSRSATIILAYLYVYESGKQSVEGKNDIYGLIEFMHSKRYQIKLSEKHRVMVEKVREIHEELSSAETPSIDVNATLKESLDRLFSSNINKREIGNLTFIKQLRIYAEDKHFGERANIIKDFLNEIDNAENCDWYIKFLANNGKLNALLEYKPAGSSTFLGTGNPIQRMELLSGLKSDLQAYIASKMEINLDELKNLVDEANDFGFQFV